MALWQTHSLRATQVARSVGPGLEIGFYKPSGNPCGLLFLMQRPFTSDLQRLPGFYVLRWYPFSKDTHNRREL